MSTTKIPVIANARELLRAHLSIENDLNSAEARDPQTKKSYSRNKRSFLSRVIPSCPKPIWMTFQRN